MAVKTGIALMALQNGDVTETAMAALSRLCDPGPMRFAGSSPLANFDTWRVWHVRVHGKCSAPGDPEGFQGVTDMPRAMDGWIFVEAEQGAAQADPFEFSKTGFSSRTDPPHAKERFHA